ncbi:MAG: hypothetical protein WCD49_02550 [Candidatus Acidiferrales bacterium]
MSKLIKLTLLLALAVGSFGAYRYSAAQESGSHAGLVTIPLPTFDVEISQEPEALATKHVLEGTYISQGFYGAVVPAEATAPIDPQLTVACPGTSGTCTIAADMWVQSNAGTSDNAISVCLYVDGKPPATGCPLTGETPADGAFAVTSFSQSVSGLAHGNHTVRTYYFTDQGAGVESYTVNYRVYKP